MLNMVKDSFVYTAAAEDAEQCFGVLTRAFESDPVCRWLWPKTGQYWEAFPQFARAFGGDAISLGTAHYHEGYSGVALWLPPGAAPDEETVARLVDETVGDELRGAAFSMFGEMAAYHPEGPHWHLPLIGVDPPSQGRGVGSELMRRALQECDRQGVLAYLEATSPCNVRLYERHGFERLGAIQVADSPEIVPMARKSR